MLDRNFCDFLEYEICKAFQHSDNSEIKGFWCDGVLLPLTDNTYPKQFINQNKYIVLKAFIGKNGQQEYELILKFGNKALRQLAKNIDIKDCVPNPDKPNWFNIDTKHYRIEIQLD